MSFWDCIQRAMDGKATDKERGQATQQAWKEQADHLEQFMDRRAAEEAAYVHVRDALKKKSAVDRHKRLSVLRTMEKNIKELSDPKLATTDDIIDAVRAPLELQVSRKSQLDSVKYDRNALQQVFQGMMGDFFSEVNENIVGTIRNQGRLMNVVRELHGTATGDAAAKAYAEAFRKTSERARQMFNSYGGHIDQLADWGLPHTHDAARIAKTSFDDWFAALKDSGMDLDRMKDFLSDRPLSELDEAGQKAVLRQIYDNIVMGRAIDGPRYGKARGQAASDRHSQRRIIHFKSADGWMKYNERFGATDPFTAISGHLSAMARDIALIKNLGPNPALGLDHRMQVASHLLAKRGVAQPDQVLRLSNANTRAMLDQLTGTALVPEDETVAMAMSNLRGFLTAAYLPRAILSSTGDLASSRMAAQAIGLNPNNVLSRHVSLMADGMAREQAKTLGYIADTLTNGGAALARFSGETPTSGVIRRLTGFVMRAQGLSYWTDMARSAMRMEMSAEFALQSGKPLKDIEGPFGDLLRARGVTDQDWDIFRRYVHEPQPGARFISPAMFRRLAEGEVPDDVADRITMKMSSIIEEQVEYAVPTESIAARAIVQREARPGSFQGEFALSALMFKSFSLSNWMNQYHRVLSIPTAAGRAAYMLEMTTAFVLMGALAVQLKELAKGNDPRPMDQPAFWGAALLQGGGVGVVADLTAASATRGGAGLGDFFLGPVGALAQDVGQLTLGNAFALARGEDINPGRQVSQMIRNTVPAVKHPLTGASWDNLIGDRIQMALDPGAIQYMQRAVRRQNADFGNGKWFGDMGSEVRLPDFSAAFGQ